MDKTTLSAAVATIFTAFVAGVAVSAKRAGEEFAFKSLNALPRFATKGGAMKSSLAGFMLVICATSMRLFAMDGFVDKTGKMVITPTFEAATSFSEGLAAIRTGKKWGFIDNEGAVKIAPQFDEVSRFRDGRARVRNGTLWGYIDKSGSWAVPAQFQYAADFSESLAAVVLATFNPGPGPGGWGYIDTSGKMVIAPQFFEARPFSEGLAMVRREGGKAFSQIDWTANRLLIGYLIDPAGYIDKTGKMVIPPSFRTALAFREGLAYTADHGPEGRMRGGPSAYIDKTGKVVIQSAPYSVSPLGEGGAVEAEIAGFGAEGSVEAASFREGLALHDAGTGSVHSPKWSYIDPKGKVVFTPDVHGGSYFSEGLARIMKGRLSLRYGFIDKNGKIVIEPTFNWAEPFMEGLAAVKVGKRWGFIDPSGKLAIEAKYKTASSFHEGLARVTIP